MAMRLKIAFVALFAGVAAFAQGLSLDDDDGQDDIRSAMQCVVEEFPGTKPITCEAPPGPPDSPCFCPEGGPAPGRRVPADQ
jgi:hypothetical protein